MQNSNLKCDLITVIVDYGKGSKILIPRKSWC